MAEDGDHEKDGFAVEYKDDGLEEERALRMAVMRADPSLKKRQSFWETPKAIVVIIAASVTATAAIVGLASYDAGKRAGQPQTITLQFVPGTVITVPSAPGR